MHEYLYTIWSIQKCLTGNRSQQWKCQGINKVYSTFLIYSKNLFVFFLVVVQTDKRLWLYLLLFSLPCFCNHVRLTIVTGSMLYRQRSLSFRSWLARSATAIIARWFIIASVACFYRGRSTVSSSTRRN